MRIRFKLRYAGGNQKIAAIKTIRTTLGLGLKEAKDFVDVMDSGASLSGSTRIVVMNEGQFGRLSAVLYRCNAEAVNPSFYIEEVTIEETPNALDLTQIINSVAAA